MRLFIAISLPEKVKNEIETAQNELRRALPIGSVRWTKREQIHLTLKFLGEVLGNRTEALTQSVQEACKKFPPLRLRAARIGFFPNANLPRVIWAGVSDRAGGLPTLQFAIESAMKEFGTQGPEKTFIGHITLGRAQNLKRPQAEILARLATGMTAKIFGEWTADKVEIVRSQLSSGSPQYSQLASVPLAGT
jgi:2'-5' RNA ligase